MANKKLKNAISKSILHIIPGNSLVPVILTGKH